MVVPSAVYRQGFKSQLIFLEGIDIIIEVHVVDIRGAEK